MSDLAEKVKRLRKLTEARAAYLAVSNPDDVNDVLDGLARLEGEVVAYGAVMERQHARIASLEAQLAAITTERRTPGTVEVCERWRSNNCSDYPQSDFDVSLCHVANCPRKQHPTPSQGTTP